MGKSRPSCETRKWDHLGGRLKFPAWIVLSLTPALAPAQDAPPVFERDIRPIFEKNCFFCHGATKPHSNGLDLKTIETILDGANSGTVVVPGKPEASRLWIVVRDGIMPQGGAPLSAAEKKLIYAWIEKGEFPAHVSADAPAGNSNDKDRKPDASKKSAEKRK
jgi:cytochrome c